MRQIVVGIEGMSCSMCESHIQDTIRQNFQVKKVKADRKKKIATIVSETDIAEQDIHKAIDPTGYTVTSYTNEEYKKKGLFGF